MVTQLLACTKRDPNAPSLVSTFLIIFMMAIELYDISFKPSDIANKIERVTG